MGKSVGTSVVISPYGKTLAIVSPGPYGILDCPGFFSVFPLEEYDNLGTSNSWKQIGQGIPGEAVEGYFGCLFPSLTMPKPLPLVPLKESQILSNG